MTDTKEMTILDLQPFCFDEQDSGKDFLMTPFTRGSWSYATNGHILVRVPARPGFAAPNTEAMADKCDDMANPANVKTYRPLRSMPLPEKHYTETECELCEGRKTDHDCPNCKCPCTECYGSGVWRRPLKVSVMIGGIPFATKYAAMLLALPGIQVPIKITPKSPMTFIFDGGSGALMPHNGGFDEKIEEPAE